ncbi:hypothetical protein N431DRAFT_449144 [Stipitochalara longipes BDJ]|nr:hypothetical protein N431DRAFT_449144 [Stipitochalara longipes BDJ]
MAIPLFEIFAFHLHRRLQSMGKWSSSVWCSGGVERRSGWSGCLGQEELKERDAMAMDGESSRLKAPLFQKQPRKNETDDRRRVLNLRDDEQASARLFPRQQPIDGGIGGEQANRRTGEQDSQIIPAYSPSAMAAALVLLSLTGTRPSFTTAIRQPRHPD